MSKLHSYIRRYTSISAVIDILQRKELSLLDPQTWDDRNDRYFMELYKGARRVGGLYGLCAATCSETYHHWRVFTSTADGACIELKRKPLEQSLDQLKDVRYGNMDYLLLGAVEKLAASDVERLPFVKRHGFAAEEEYRIVAETKGAQRPSIPIDLPVEMINKIYLNPWLPKSIADSLATTLHRIDGCEEIAIQRSHLIESNRWKKAGDFVVGKMPPPKIKLRKTKG